MNLLDCITDGICAVNRDWLVTYINPRAASNIHQTPEEVIGQSIWKVSPQLLGTVWEDHYRKVMVTRLPAQFEEQSLLQDTWYLVNVYPTSDGILVYWIDQTTRKHSEDHILGLLAENERHKALLQAIFAADPGCVAVLDGPDLFFTYINPAYRYILPDPSRDPIGQPYTSIWPQQSEFNQVERLKEVLSCGKPFQLTNIEYHFSAGTSRVFTMQARRIEWEDRSAVLIILWDVTEQKFAENTARSLALFPEQNPNPILRLTHEGLVLLTNPAARNLLPEIQVGIVAPAFWRQVVTEVFREGRQRLTDYQYQGRYYVFDVVPILDMGYINLYGRDITERKQVEENLREQEEKFQELLRNTQAAIYEIDFRKRRFTSVNEAMCQLSGYTKAELLKMDPFDILDDAGRQQFRERIKLWLNGELPTQTAEYKVRAKDGHEIYALLNVTFTAGADGKPVGATVIGYDVTQRKLVEIALQEREKQLLQANEALRKSQQHLVNILGSITEAYVAYDRDWRLLAANPAAMEVIFEGRPVEEVMGKVLWELYPQLVGREFYHLYHQAVEAQHPLHAEIQSIINKRWWEVHAYPGEEGLEVYLREITERKRIEADLRNHTST